MADMYGLEASGIDPEIAAKMLGLKSKRAIAEAMLQQSMGGLQAPPTPAGGYAVPISPLAGVAKVLQAYMADKQLKGLDEEGAKLAGESQRRMGEALKGYEQTRVGTPEAAPMVANDDEGNRMPNVSATPGNPRQAIIEAMSKGLGGNPLVKADMMALEKSNQPYTLTAGAQRFGPDNKPLAAAGFKPDRPKPPMNDFQIAQLKEMIIKGTDMGMDMSSLQTELQSAIAARSAINGPPQMPVAPPAAPAPPAGIPPEVLAAGMSGKPFVATQAPGQAPQFQTPPGLAPRDQRAIDVDRAKTKIDLEAKNAERENVRQFGMQGIGETIAQAERLLNSKPTGSGVGTVVDSVASIFGKTPAGANEAQALKAIGGALVSKMPRMQGPQSDKDVMLYTQMAAQVGDSTVPAERRKAALQEVKRLWAKYERVGSEEAAPSAPPSIDDLLKKYGK